MMKKSYLIIIITVLMLVLTFGFIFLRNETANAPSGDSSEQSEVAEKQTETDNEEEAVTKNEITYSDDGFSPGDITVNEGEEVVIINNSSEALDFASDDHPTHQTNSELNVGLIEPGERDSFSPSKGEWGYHDHLNSSATGTITVR